MPEMVKLKVYKYDELEPTAQAKVRSDHEEWLHDWTWESVEEDLKQDAYNLFGTLTTWNLTYSFSFSQGDGVGLAGWLEATDIPDPEWVKTVLPLLGANVKRAKLGSHQVSWPFPIRNLRIDFDNNRREPFFLESELRLTLYPLQDVYDGSPEEEVEIWKGNHDDASDLWDAVVLYFSTTCRKLYTDTCDSLLDDSHWESFIECHDDWRFDEDGRRVDGLCELIPIDQEDDDA